MTLLDKETVIRDLKHRMGYKEESERICSYCKSNEEQGEELQCVFNPTYKFRVSPLGSCTNFGHTNLHMDLHKL